MRIKFVEELKSRSLWVNIDGHDNNNIEMMTEMGRNSPAWLRGDGWRMGGQ